MLQKERECERASGRAPTLHAKASRLSSLIETLQSCRQSVWLCRQRSAHVSCAYSRQSESRGRRVNYGERFEGFTNWETSPTGRLRRSQNARHHYAGMQTGRNQKPADWSSQKGHEASLGDGCQSKQLQAPRLMPSKAGNLGVGGDAAATFAKVRMLYWGWEEKHTHQAVGISG